MSQDVYMSEGFNPEMLSIPQFSYEEGEDGEIIMTVFFCGTASNQFDRENNRVNYGEDGELITGLHQYIEGSEYAHYLNVDGPGSGNLQRNIAWVDQGTPNKILGLAFGLGMEVNVEYALAVIKGKATYTPKEDQGRIEMLKNELRKADYQVYDSNTGKERSMTDEEIQSEIERLLHIKSNMKITEQMLQEKIVEIKRKGKKVGVVNFVGWSRGGVEAFKAANMMWNDDELKHIDVNIFAVDPVTGPFRYDNEHTLLPPNVKNCTCVYATDERLGAFTPIIPEHAEGHTNLHIEVMAGAHGTLVGCSNTLEAAKEVEEFESENAELKDEIQKLQSELENIENQLGVVEKGLSQNPDESTQNLLLKRNEELFIQLANTINEIITKTQGKEKLNQEFIEKGHDELRAPFWLVQDMALRFLRDIGGVLLKDNAPKLSLEQRLDYYDNILKYRAQYRNLRKLYPWLLRGDIDNSRKVQKGINGNISTTLEEEYNNQNLESLDETLYVNQDHKEIKSKILINKLKAENNNKEIKPINSKQKNKSTNKVMKNGKVSKKTKKSEKIRRRAWR